MLCVGVDPLVAQYPVLISLLALVVVGYVVVMYLCVGLMLVRYRVPVVMVSIINLMCSGGVLSCFSSEIICWSEVSLVLATSSLIMV